MRFLFRLFILLFLVNCDLYILDAQSLTMSKEQLIALTPKWEGERFADGRPRVPGCPWISYKE